MTRTIQSLGRGSRLNLAGFMLACIALFVALGGPSYAASSLPKNSVKSKMIIDGQVKSGDIADKSVQSVDMRDATIGLVDLSPAATAALMSILDGSVTTPKLADGAVTNPKLADNAVNSAKVEDNTLTSGDVLNQTLTNLDLAASSVGGSELAANSVEGDEVSNGTLDGVDIGEASGIVSLNFPNVGAGECVVRAPAVSGVQEGDQVTASPEPDFDPEAQAMVFYGMGPAADGFIRIIGCNVSAADIDLGPVDFHYTAIDN
jgi:hypothetical protein